MEGENAGSKVLAIKATSNSCRGDFVPVAERVAKELRRLYFEGYDLRFAEVCCYLVRDDRPIELGGR